MLEVDNHSSDIGKGIISCCIEEITGKPLLYIIHTHTNMDGQYKIDDIELDDGPLRSDGTENATRRS